VLFSSVHGNEQRNWFHSVYENSNDNDELHKNESANKNDNKNVKTEMNFLPANNICVFVEFWTAPTLRGSLILFTQVYCRYITVHYGRGPKAPPTPVL